MRSLPILLFLLAALPAHPRVRPARLSVAEDPATWLRQQAVPLADVDSIRAVIGNAQIVALGDATHGTHELYASKVRIIESLVEAGFRTIAFEAPFGQFDAIREYVLTGRGDPAELLRSSDYFFW
ncbi:MAG TPA: hypothetical protein VF698_06645, partial [Thermoanaerobaculia bacterium]